jgi:hypothetical protein
MNQLLQRKSHGRAEASWSCSLVATSPCFGIAGGTTSLDRYQDTLRHLFPGRWEGWRND